MWQCQLRKALWGIGHSNPTHKFRALELLYSLGAIDKNGNLTDDIGWKLAEMPIEPRLGVLLINSGNFLLFTL
jgi:HrpA-like helicases